MEVDEHRKRSNSKSLRGIAEGPLRKPSPPQKLRGPATPAFLYRCFLPDLAGFEARRRRTHT
jgi:hypothetical protein